MGTDTFVAMDFTGLCLSTDTRLPQSLLFVSFAFQANVSAFDKAGR